MTENGPVTENPAPARASYINLNRPMMFLAFIVMVIAGFKFGTSSGSNPATMVYAIAGAFLLYMGVLEILDRIQAAEKNTLAAIAAQSNSTKPNHS